MDKDQHSYRMFNVLNKEFTFTVDVSNMPCGKAGTMYFVEMAGDGGLGQGNNQAGARYTEVFPVFYPPTSCITRRSPSSSSDIPFIISHHVVTVSARIYYLLPYTVYGRAQNGTRTGDIIISTPRITRYGTGYCDAACAQDLKFVEGKANLEQNVGSCCGEFDIWESNKTSTAFTAHPCKGGRTTCNSDQTCGSGPKGDPDKYRYDWGYLGGILWIATAVFYLRPIRLRRVYYYGTIRPLGGGVHTTLRVHTRPPSGHMVRPCTSGV